MPRDSLPATIAIAMLASLGAVPVSVSAQSTHGPDAGKALFESKCVACHSLDASRVGPLLRGVVGRKVASVARYEYSDALKGVKGRWDSRRLEMWLQDPQSVAPGAKMAFSLPSRTERSAVIQYLAATSAPMGAVKP
ncbi:MAG: c-type cytochrome [Gemmatimonadales bacterium]